MKPKKPFMITREDSEPGDCYAKFDKGGNFKKWVDWEGTKFATKAEADAHIAANPIVANNGAKVIEILDEVRHRSSFR